MKLENENSNEAEKTQLNIPDVSGSFSMQDLFDAFSHYAFCSMSNQPYNEAELMEHFDKWFKQRFGGK